MTHIERNHILTSNTKIIPGKTYFPEDWSKSTVKTAIEDIANRNTNVRIINNTQGRPGIIKIGDYNGIHIKTVIQNGRITTGFPIGK